MTLQFNGQRIHKPPTRRQLAQAVQATIPVVNAQSGAMDKLHERISHLEFVSERFHGLTRWQRLKWLLW